MLEAEPVCVKSTRLESPLDARSYTAPPEQKPATTTSDSNDVSKGASGVVHSARRLHGWRDLPASPHLNTQAPRHKVANVSPNVGRAQGLYSSPMKAQSPPATWIASPQDLLAVMMMLSTERGHGMTGARCENPLARGAVKAYSRLYIESRLDRRISFLSRMRTAYLGSRDVSLTSATDR